MGYDGEKIVEANRLKAVGGREVGKFWGENDVLVVIGGLVIFLLSVLILYIIFSPAAIPPRQEQQKRQLEPLVPPLLFHEFHLAPRPLPPSDRQKREKAMPIHWSGGHHGGHHSRHHDHHDYYRAPYYSYPMRPWGYDGYGGCYGCGYGRGYYEEEERRPYFELHRGPNGETQMRWGFQ